MLLKSWEYFVPFDDDIHIYLVSGHVHHRTPLFGALANPFYFNLWKFLLLLLTINQLFCRKENYFSSGKMDLENEETTINLGDHSEEDLQISGMIEDYPLLENILTNIITSKR